MSIYYIIMVAGDNLLLEYTIDTLLKTLNPDDKPVVRKKHFYKIMDILNTRLLKQKINIKYPNYWYKYGSVTDITYLDQIIPNGFSGRYFDGNNFYFPRRHRINYDIDLQTQHIIRSTIRSLCEQYKYKPDYGELLKKESYRLNSPYLFNTTFQEYLKVIDNQNQSTLIPKKELLESLLTKLMAEFPEEDFPELLDMYLMWCNTTFIVLTFVENKLKDKCLIDLTALFWDTYSKGIRSIYNKYYPAEYVLNWKSDYEESRLKSESNLETLREKIVTERDFESDIDNNFVKKVLKRAYELEV